jgi:hypothetical protein
MFVNMGEFNREFSKLGNDDEAASIVRRTIQQVHAMVKFDLLLNERRQYEEASRAVRVHTE